MRKLLLSAASFALLGIIACQPQTAVEVEEPINQQVVNETPPIAEKPITTVESLTAAATAGTENGPPTIQEAKEFLEQAEKDLVEVTNCETFNASCQ